MEQHIIELIKSNNRIIIPGFGAFLIAREKGYTVLFNNFLNFNDGLLADYVAKKENISSDEANSRIEQYVSRIKETLLTKGSYSIPQLGTFTSDASGNFHFEQSTFLNTEMNKPTETIKPSEDDELLSIDPITTILPQEEPIQPISNTELTSKIMADPLIELQPQEKIHQKTSAKQTSPQIAMNNKQKKKDPEKKNSWIWILIPISLFAIFAVYYFYFRQEGRITVGEPQEAPSMLVDTLFIPDTTTPQLAHPIRREATTKAFHIIVGSYKNPSQAEERVKHLIGKGYSNATYFSRGDWYVVSIEALPTLTDAERVQEEILDRDRIESWIVNNK